MDLGELGDFLAGSLDFTIDGRHYSVPPVAWPVYLEMLAAQEHAVAVSEGRAKPEDGPEDKPIYKLAPVVLGPVLDELISDGVSGPRVMVLARAAYLFQIGEHEVAKALLASGGKVQIPPPPSESTSRTRTGSTSSGSVSGTKRAASSTGTRSQTKSKPRSPRTKPALAATP